MGSLFHLSWDNFVDAFHVGSFGISSLPIVESRTYLNVAGRKCLWK